jgi:hypothetical protein
MMVSRRSNSARSSDSGGASMMCLKKGAFGKKRRKQGHGERMTPAPAPYDGPERRGQLCDNWYEFCGITKVWLARTSEAMTRAPPASPKTPKPGITKISKASPARPKQEQQDLQPTRGAVQELAPEVEHKADRRR